MSKLKVDEIRSADRSVSSTANITLADDGSTTIPNGTLSAGTIGSGVTVAEGGIFKCIKNYHCGVTINPGSKVGNSTTGWTKKSGLSQSWADVGPDFTIHGGSDLQFPVTGIWQITYYFYFYKQASSMNQNMECTPHIYNGTSWYGLDYIRVGENYEGSTWTRGGGAKTVFINVTSTDFRTAIYNQTNFSSGGIHTGGEITFLCLTNT